MRTTLMFVCSLFLMAGCCAKGPMGSACPGGAGPEAGIPAAEAGRELADVHFAFDSAELDATAKDILNRNANWMKANAGRNVVIEGHCDERGTNEYNMALGERRARSAYNYLKSLGVAEKQMSTISYGEEVPLDPGRNEAAWAKNRRGHFSVK